MFCDKLWLVVTILRNGMILLAEFDLIFKEEDFRGEGIWGGEFMLFRCLIFSQCME